MQSNHFLRLVVEISSRLRIDEVELALCSTIALDDDSQAVSLKPLEAPGFQTQ